MVCWNQSDLPRLVRLHLWGAQRLTVSQGGLCAALVLAVSIGLGVGFMLSVLFNDAAHGVTRVFA